MSSNQQVWDGPPVCLYTRDGQLSNVDMAVVREFSNFLRAHYEASPDDAERLARARQAMAAVGVYAPDWAELTDHERELAVLDARNYLIAAHLAGLIS